MDQNEHKINRNLIIGWMLIVIVLLAAYFGEFLKGERSGIYMTVFSFVTAIPAIICALLYGKDKSNPKLRYYIICGYYIMYIFVLMTGNTILVFTYILPLLTLIVLYHQSNLVLLMGVISLLSNLAYDIKLYLAGTITLENSRDIEIQIALIILCFGFLYAASRMYQDTFEKNKAYLKELDEKQQQIQRVTLQTITTIANIIDAKDEYTKGHSQRVAEYSSAIARELGYDEDAVRNVKYIGLLHDIGKIGIPDAILNKPGKLTDAEFQLMKQHVEIGAGILKDNNMIKDLENGVRFHHERFDGRGYLDGLKGEDIPEIARIIGIADAYDAMTSNRVYRKRLSDEDVIAELENCSGTQFDPHIANTFVRLIKNRQITHLSPDSVSASDNLGEQSSQLLQDIIDMQNAQDNRNQELDYLTNAFNRKIGEQRIAEQLTEKDGLLLLVDIRNLREINTRYGFLSGDYLIKAVADGMTYYRNDTIMVRFDGDELLCFIPGITKEDAAETLMTEMHAYIEKHIHERKEYEITSICVGGALSSMLGRDYTTLQIAADKAVYYLKQLKKSGCYLYRNADRKKDENKNLSKKELGQLVHMIKKDSSYNGTYNVDYPEFVKIYEFVKSMSDRNNQSVQLILLTLSPIDEKNTAVEERDTAMGYLESSINTSLRKVDIMMRFSSTQCIIFLINLNEEQIHIVVNRIMNQFYKSYDKKDMVLNYDVADLNQIPEQLKA